MESEPPISLQRVRRTLSSCLAQSAEASDYCASRCGEWMRDKRATRCGERASRAIASRCSPTGASASSRAALELEEAVKQAGS